MEKAKANLKKNDIKEGKERFKKLRDQKPSREELIKNLGIIEDMPQDQPKKKIATPEAEA